MMMKKPGLLLVIMLTGILLKAQDYTGIWQGYITMYEIGSYNAGYTLHVKSHAENIITGRAYLYRDELAVEGELDFIGRIDNKTCKVTELAILKSKTRGKHEYLCYKLLNLQFSHKGNSDYLTGKWNGAIYNDVECIPGNVYLKRYSPNDPDGIEPIPELVMTKILNDKLAQIPFMSTTLAKPLILNVKNRVVKLEIRDYLRQDNDTVSVYYNRNLIIDRLHLTKKAKVHTIRLDRLSGMNEIVMYANNLGLVPPNTSILTVSDGVSKQQVNIVSTKQLSAVVYLNYSP